MRHNNGYGGCGRPSAEQNLFSSSADRWYMLGLDPTFTIAVNNSKTIEFKYGDSYVPYTSGTYRKTAVRIARAPGSSFTGDIGIRVRSYLYSGGQWQFYKELLPFTSYAISSSGIETSSFPVEVPAEDSLRIDVTITAQTDQNAALRMVFMEPEEVGRFVFKHNDSTKLTLFEDGNATATGLIEMSPRSGGFHFIRGDDAVLTIGSNGNVIVDRMDQGNADRVLDSQGYLSGGFNLAYLEAANLNASQNNIVTIRRYVNEQSALRPVFLRSFSNNYYAGSTMSIYWGRGPVSTVQSVNLYWKKVADANWSPIASNQNAALGNYSWGIPTSLANEAINIKISDAHVSTVYDIYTYPIMIQDALRTITYPDGSMVFSVGEPIRIKWHFEPPKPPYLVRYSVNQGRTFSLVGDAGTDGNFIDWVFPAECANKRVMFKVHNYSDANDCAYSDEFQVN